MSEDRDAQWRCAVCGKHYVVPALARECEKKHKESK